MWSKIFDFFVNNKFVVVSFYVFSFVFTFYFVYKIYDLKRENQRNITEMQKKIDSVVRDMDASKKVYSDILVKADMLEKKYNERIIDIEVKYSEEYKKIMKEFYEKLILLSRSDRDLEEKLKAIGFGEYK